MKPEKRSLTGIERKYIEIEREREKREKHSNLGEKRSAGILSGTIVIIIIFSQCRLTKVTLNA